MEVTYQLLESEFDQKIVKSIKSTFKNSLITIIVRNGQNANFLAEKEHDFYAKIQSAEKADFEYHLSSDELEKFIKDSTSGNEPDDEIFKREIPSMTYQTSK